MVGVGMGQDDRSHICRRPAHLRQRRDYPIPIARPAGVDQGHLASLDHQHPADVLGPGMPHPGRHLTDVKVPHRRHLLQIDRVRPERD
jgi:hypothetical protein